MITQHLLLASLSFHISEWKAFCKVFAKGEDYRNTTFNFEMFFEDKRLQREKLIWKLSQCQFHLLSSSSVKPNILYFLCSGHNMNPHERFKGFYWSLLLVWNKKRKETGCTVAESLFNNETKQCWICLSSLNAQTFCCSESRYIFSRLQKAKRNISAGLRLQQTKSCWIKCESLESNFVNEFSLAPWYLHRFLFHILPPTPQ